MLTRRHFLSATAAGLAAPAWLRAENFAPQWNHFPFSLGVASGAPSPNGFVLWTRLAPNPLSSDAHEPGGMSGGDVPLRFEIAEDENLQRIVYAGEALAEARYGYSVHAIAGGLKPDRPYWYRFTSGNAQSRVGRARTLPAAGAQLERLRFGFVSCSNYEHGYFAAYRHLAEEHPDFVLYLGDYIYEGIDKESTNLVRRHSDGVVATDLRTYRNRYSQYQLDENLQQLRAAATSLITWDDHEVSNDYGDLLSQDFADPQEFKKRRAAAYQAFYENMPVTPTREPDGPYLRVYDRYALGDLAEIFMTDARQYRSAAACYGRPNPPGRLLAPKACPQLLDESRSILGTEQEKWLNESLSKSKARWNILGQSLLVAQFRRRDKTGEEVYWTDDWNGFPASRQRLLRHIHEAQVQNVVSLGGDIHSFWANDLKLNFDDPHSPTVASEFVGTSISAHPPTFDFAPFLPENPHVRFCDKSVRGYVSVEITPTKILTKFQALEDPRDPKSAVHTLKSFVVEANKPGVVIA